MLYTCKGIKISLSLLFLVLFVRVLFASVPVKVTKKYVQHIQIYNNIYLTLVSGSHSAITLICGGPQPVPQDISALHTKGKATKFNTYNLLLLNIEMLFTVRSSC